MASTTDSSNRRVVVAAKPKSLMLKDFLRDDLSSCSSNGFRSFPRRQCCTTTVRFLLEIDLKLKDSSVTKRFLPRTASRKIALSTISTLQRASVAVVRAFKQFPFPSSRKLAFWKKSEIVDPIKSTGRPWKSFREFLDEKEPPPSSKQSRDDSAAGRNSTSCCTSNSISWTESEFTSEMIPSSSSGNSESCSENDAVKEDKDSSGNLIGLRDGVTFGKDSIEESTTTTTAADATTTTAYLEEIVKEWGNEEEKEQLSPVSVLDFPFDDEDSLHQIEGKKQKHPQKLEPVDLKKRFTDLDHVRRPDFSSISKKEHQREEKAIELLKLVKSTTKSQCFIYETENLLLDFFHEKLEENESTRARRGGGSDFDAHILKLTEDWINGESEEMVVRGWESPEGRNLYIKDMEMAGKWRSFTGDLEELAAELEDEVWISLLNELLIASVITN